MKDKIILSLIVLLRVIPIFAQESLKEVSDRLVNKTWIQYRYDSKMDNPVPLVPLKYLFKNDNTVIVWKEGKANTATWKLENDANGLDQYVIIDNKRYIITFIKKSKSMKLREIADSKASVTNDQYFRAQ